MDWRGLLLDLDSTCNQNSMFSLNPEQQKEWISK